MAAKPLTHLGMECVIQYMDPNKRFQLSSCCATIRPIDKKLPLTVDYLNIGRNQLTINDTSYKLGVFQKYPKEMVMSKKVAYDNCLVGMQLDLDQYGFLLPRYGIDEYKKEIEQAEKRIQSQKEEVVQKLKMFRNKENETTKEFREEIKELDAQLKPFALRRANIQPPWKMVLKISISTGWRNKKVEFAKYNNLKDDLAQVVAHLFAGYKVPVLLKTWELNLPDFALPSYLKLRVKSFSTLERFVDWDRVRQNIHQSTYPLEFIEAVSVASRTPEIIKTARKVVISNGYRLCFKGFLCQSLEIGSVRNGGAEEFAELIRSWMETGMPIGTCYKFGGFDRDFSILRQLKEQFNGAMDNRYLRIPMNSKSNIEICIVKGDIIVCCYFKYSFKFRIVAA